MLPKYRRKVVPTDRCRLIQEGIKNQATSVHKTGLLERVAQIPLVVAGTYDTYDSVSHGTNKHYDAQSHDRNSASANNSSDGGFSACI